MLADMVSTAGSGPTESTALSISDSLTSRPAHSFTLLAKSSCYRVPNRRMQLVYKG